MKAKSILLIIVFLLAPLSVHAQWHIGGILDLNIASFNVDDPPSSEEYSSRLGFGIGAVVDRVLTDVIDIHSGLMFLQKGGKITEDGDEATLKLGYIEIPIMIRYVVNSGAETPIFVMAGTSIGFMTGAEADINGGPSFDIKDEFNTVDLGLGFGGGIKKPMGNKIIFAEARFVIGLSDVSSEIGDVDVKNTGFQIAVGATIPISN